MLLDSLDSERIKTSPDMVTLYDTALRIISWNESCEKRFKIPAATAEGKLLNELFPDIVSDYRYACLQDAANEGKSFYFTNRS